MGTRLSYTGNVVGNLGNSSQIWAKPLGKSSHAVMMFSTGPMKSSFHLPFNNISTDFVGKSVCVRDLYTKQDHGPFNTATHNLDATVLPHDSVFYCVRPAVGGSCASFGGCPSF